MQATCATPRDLTVLFARLVDVERHSTTQEWWMYGRVLPEARNIAEVISLLAAARAELGQLLDALGVPHPVKLNHPGTTELRFAQSFAGDEGWAVAHREEAISVLRMTATAIPLLLAQAARISYYLEDRSSATSIVRRSLARLAVRLNEIRALSAGY